MSVSAPDLVAGRFEILRVAGAGGMGTVYRARDLLLGGDVALKVLHDTRNPLDVERLAREAVVLSDLKHPGIVRYAAHGIDDAGRVYLAMEWLEGVTLADRMAQKRFDLRDAIDIVRSASLALEAAHARGIVHRDVKPSNLFVSSERPMRIKVLDFGIARVLSSAVSLTHTGHVLGTAHYMAPEQARGASDLDARADVFALGCVLFQLLTGRLPFVGETLAAVLARILFEDPPRVADLRPDIPDGVNALVEQMLDKDPAARFPDAGAVARALDELGDSSAPAHSLSSVPPAAMTTTERRILCVIMAGGLGARSTSARTLQGGSVTIDDRVRDIVREHGGRAELLADGSLVATMSGRGAPTDEAGKAARCALALAARLEGVPIALVAGRGVLTTRTPVGEVIDRAVKVLSDSVRSRSSSIALDPLMASLLEGRFDLVQEEGRILLKGARPVAQSARTLLGKPMPCVGRDRELASLRAMIDQSQAESVARVALVTGPPGSGKTRLAQELMSRLEAEQSHAVLFAWGDSLRAGSPFSLLGQGMRRAADILDGESLEARRAKLVALVARHIEPPDQMRVAGMLGELVRAPFPDEASDVLRAARRDAMLMNDGVRRAVLDLLEAECRERPLVVVLDDLQWGDLPTVTLLDLALDKLADSPIAVIAFARPEVAQSFPTLFAERELENIKLPKLTRKASERLVRVAVPEIGDEPLSRIVQRGDGNPFLLEELVRAHAASGSGEPPESVLAMVQARLDGLSPDVRLVLRAASMFGPVFWTGAVRSMVGDEADDVDVHLDFLALEEIIEQSATSVFPGEIEWRFRTALVREASYAMLTDSDRALGHMLAAKWLESHGARDPLLLAEHFDRGNVRGKAAEWYARAAEQALVADDFDRALDLASRGVKVGSEQAHLARCRLVEAEVLRWRASYQEARLAASYALEGLDPGSVRWYQAAGVVIAASGNLSDLEELSRYTHITRTTPPLPGAEAMQLVTLCRAAPHYLGSGQHAVASDLIDEVQMRAALLERPDPLVSGWLCTLAGTRELHRGAHVAYVEGATAAIALFEQAGDFRLACNQRVRLAYGYVELGAYERAEAILRIALQSAERMGLRLIEGYALQNLGNAIARGGGRAAEAKQLGMRAVDLGVKLESPRLEGTSRLYLAQIAFDEGAYDFALEQAEIAGELLSTARSLRAVARTAAARAYAAIGDLERAKQASDESFALMESLTGMEEGEALVWLAGAEVALGAGDRDLAFAHVERARASILARSTRISDPELRESFLTRVPENARVMQLWENLRAPS